jgi:hypothetical protein
MRVGDKNKPGNGRDESGGFMRPTVVWILCLWGASLISGCSIFEPREAQPPRDVTQTGIPYIPPNDASGVFPNLKSGVENLSSGQNYKRSLSETFNFVPLLDDKVDLGAQIFEGWSKEVEGNVLDFILSGADSIEVDFNPVVKQDETDFVQYRVDYTLRIVPTGGGPVQFYRAVAEFDMRRIGAAGWKLDVWEDIEPVGDFTSWGYLRGTIRDQIE